MIDWAAPSLDAYTARFKSAMDEDFGTPEAVAVLYELASEVNKTRSAELAGLLKALGACLGLLQGEPARYLQAGAGLDDDSIQVLIAERADAKRAKDFAAADRIRSNLLDKGIVLKDSPAGTTWEVQT
jgi:cysteinyl-tRNA synthetase